MKHWEKERAADTLFVAMENREKEDVEINIRENEGWMERHTHRERENG
jgi:hypothetical protein